MTIDTKDQLANWQQLCDGPPDLSAHVYYEALYEATRLIDALLTEHSAREHPLGCDACMVEIRKAVARGVTYLDNSMLCSVALPATEPAQPDPAAIEYHNAANEPPRESDPWPVIEWLRESNPAALELCPYKVEKR